MEALSLSGPHQLLGKSKTVINEELDQLDTISNSPEERHRLFVGNIKAREKEFSIGPNGLANYTYNAVDDMWLLSRSAFNYLEENNQVAEVLINCHSRLMSGYRQITGKTSKEVG
jgi:hypothetical protein